VIVSKQELWPLPFERAIVFLTLIEMNTNDELEAIERAANNTSPMPERPESVQVPASARAPAPKGRRRGSSNFTMPKGPMMETKPVAEPPPPVGDRLLEPFGQRGGEKPAGTGSRTDGPAEKDLYGDSKRAPVAVPPAVVESAPKRGSVVMKPMPFGGLVDFEDSDFDDSDEDDEDDDDVHLPGRPMSVASNAAAVGGPNHRPLVGGFAAAAYEAARAHHYASINQGEEKVSMPKRAGPPPSI